MSRYTQWAKRPTFPKSWDAPHWPRDVVKHVSHILSLHHVGPGCAQWSYLLLADDSGVLPRKNKVLMRKYKSTVNTSIITVLGWFYGISYHNHCGSWYYQTNPNNIIAKSILQVTTSGNPWFIGDTASDALTLVIAELWPTNVAICGDRLLRRFWWHLVTSPPVLPNGSLLCTHMDRRPLRIGRFPKWLWHTQW